MGKSEVVSASGELPVKPSSVSHSSHSFINVIDI